MFYTYVLLDPRYPGNFNYQNISIDYKPFYIGKGMKNRISRHLCKHNVKKSTHQYRTINKLLKLGLSPISIIIFNNLTEEEAFIKEIELISFYKRKIDGGILCNHTLGGEGISGFKMSPDTIKKLKLIRSGKMGILSKSSKIIYQ